MRKFCALWVPKYLIAEQKRQRYQFCEQRLEILRRDPNVFLSRLVTTDETWLYHYDPEKKQQSMELRHNGSPHHKISECKRPPEISRLNFLVSWKHPPIDYLPKDQTINAEYYLTLLVQLKNILKENHHGKFNQGGLAFARQCSGSLGTWNPEETG